MAGAGLAQDGRLTGNIPLECDSDKLLFKASADGRRPSSGLVSNNNQLDRSKG
jgi:hypothetical protein